jgi:hypothetical protein
MGAGLFLNTPITGEPIEYDDLAEREKRISDLLTTSCLRKLAIKKFPFAHRASTENRVAAGGVARHPLVIWADDPAPPARHAPWLA